MALTDFIINEAAGGTESSSEFTRFAENLPEEVVSVFIEKNSDFIQLVVDVQGRLTGLHDNLSTVSDYLSAIDQIINAMTKSSNVMQDIKELVQTEATKQGITW